MQQWLPPEGDAEACDAFEASSLYGSGSTDGSTAWTNTNVKSGSECGGGDEERAWQFTVLMQEDLMVSEKMAVVGNCKNLGNWQLSSCVIMSNGYDRGESTIMDDGM